MTDKQSTKKRAPQRQSQTSSQRAPQKNNRTQNNARVRNNSEPLSRDEKRRENAIRRKKARRRKKIIAYTIIIFILLVAGITLSLTVFFKTNAITVTGDEIYNYEQITEASGITMGDNLFLIKKGEVSDSIEKSLPYIEEAELKRHLSGKMEIKITAAKVSLAIYNGETYTLLSSSCKVLENNVMVVNDDVILVTASEVAAANPGEYIKFTNETDIETIDTMMTALSQSEMTGVTGIDISSHLNVKFTYNEKITVELGSVDTVSSKIEFVRATLKDIVEERPNFEGTIDFTIDEKGYVREKRE